MSLFQNKYRISSARLQSFDYGSNACYFVTICTKDKEHYFGGVSNDEVELSALGVTANVCWEAIPDHFPFAELGVHIVMPNHVHGIVIINKPQIADHIDSRNVETQDFASLQPNNVNRFGPQSKNLASIIRGYKIGVTKYAQQNDIIFKWQPRFHDHIIRNEESFINISNYILTNPQRWDMDDYR